MSGTTAVRNLPCARQSPRAAGSDRTRPAFSFRVLDRRRRRRRRPKPTCVSSWKATRFSPFSRPSSCGARARRTLFYLYAGFRNLFFFSPGVGSGRQSTDEQTPTRSTDDHDGERRSRRLFGERTPAIITRRGEIK